MTAQHPSVHPVPAGSHRFVSLRLPAREPAARAIATSEIVLARVDDEPRPHDLVVVRGRAGDAGDTNDRGRADDGGGLEVRKIGRVTPESVELIPLDEGAPPRVVPRAGDAVVGTVLLRWRAG